MITDEAGQASWLYKYQSFVEAFARSTLLDSKLWFSSPLDFNDPFDCRPVIDTSGSKEELLFWMTKRVIRINPGISMVLALKRARVLAAQFSPEIIDEDMDRGGADALGEMLKTLGVLSLTTRDDDVLMWSHYAANHAGVCWRFNRNVPFFQRAAEVKYVKARPVFRVLDSNREDLADRILLAKADFWDREAEWRIVEPDTVGLVKFPSEALTGVIIGCAMRESEETVLRKLLDQRPERVEILRAVVDRKNYRIAISSEGYSK